MIHIEFSEQAFETHCPNFVKWKTEADEKTKNLIGAYARQETLQFESTFWSRIKPGLIQLFYGNCAYCQKEIIDNPEVQVEHFRPKGRVEEDEKHPGYFWLAYSLRNYYPSCGTCNGKSAKGNYFPVENRAYRYGPADVTQEVPLLLSPYDDYPERDHLDVIVQGAPEDIGKLRARSVRGEETIRVFKLNRETLRKARVAAMRSCELEWQEAIRPENLRKGALGNYHKVVFRGAIEFSLVRRRIVEGLIREMTAQALP